MWLVRAAKTKDRARAEEMRRLAGYLEDSQLQARQIKIFRKLFTDYGILRDDLTRITINGDTAPIDADTRTGMSLLHAIRLTLIHEIFRLATHIPQFSNQHNTTHPRVIARILHLDIPTAVAQLERIFPATSDTLIDGDFGERATYVSDESQNYKQENDSIFKVMDKLYELLRRVSVALTHRVGFFG